ncbi:hypothetical protein [Streptomyces antarcticus]|uniref:hypothetical protein n=1 Tax=Streptomyces antarcticus TaxID=2996458 RepID=UPI00226DA3FC|nr:MULTISPECIES: hypothetical protein [unclassified Streptomyces]MCY0941926.1 hypothetical protein [Streptomyces sp. H34-AA3]MCZ4082802.1 hypothetical protein [Streptomyces sp. H34-S5]
MQDLNTDKVILNKVVRHKRFILGKSVALASSSVALMDDGSVRIITERRPEHFLPSAPRVVTHKPFASHGQDVFNATVLRLRVWEGAYITGELPEGSA